MRKESSHISYKEGYKYQLTCDAWFRVDIYGYSIETKYITLYDDGWIWIKAGYAWDGASGPTIDTKNSMRGSLLHDAIYQLLRTGLLPSKYRLVGDRELEIRCVEDGMWKIRAELWEKALREFGKDAADPKNKKQEIWAP